MFASHFLISSGVSQLQALLTTLDDSFSFLTWSTADLFMENHSAHLSLAWTQQWRSTQSSQDKSTFYFSEMVFPPLLFGANIYMCFPKFSAFLFSLRRRNRILWEIKIKHDSFIVFKDIFIYLCGIGRHKKHAQQRDILFVGSRHKWLKQPELG